jgi:uncharacterized protein YqeY
MEKLFPKINEDLKAAMKAKDTTRLETLRMMKSKILLVNARGDLPDAEIIKILLKYAKSLKQSIEEFKKVNRPDEAKTVEGEIKIIEEYLPKQLSEDEIREVVKKAIEEVGAESPKQMGLVMKKVMSDNAGIDGAAVRRIVSEILK